jgi:hypothetical protein
MNEKEWPKSADAGPMLESLRGNATGRKLRLFACACCRPLLKKRDMYQIALDVAEWVAEGKAPRRAVREMEEYYTLAMEDGGPLTWALKFALDPDLPETGLGHDFTDWAAGLRQGVSEEDERARFADLVRCIFGNPFRPVAADPRWLTPDAVALAKGIYEEKAFDRLPILADALQDAGCDNADVLGHCRGPGPHALGCWVVDLVLGKS